MHTIGERLVVVREQIARAAASAGRAASEVRLVGVTKTHPPEVVRQALAAGLCDFGENRVQEAEAKIAALGDVRDQITWHLIGHLQTNKARRAAALFDMIHSVDSLRLAQALDRHAGAAGRQLPVLIQVNVSGEASKEGFALAGWREAHERLDAFRADLEPLLALHHLRVSGLMTIAPWEADPDELRETFRSTRELRDTLARLYPQAGWHELSMGMTDDFAIAIAEGATLVRIGRAIFGERQA